MLQCECINHTYRRFDTLLVGYFDTLAALYVCETEWTFLAGNSKFSFFQWMCQFSHCTQYKTFKAAHDGTWGRRTQCLNYTFIKLYDGILRVNFIDLHHKNITCISKVKMRKHTEKIHIFNISKYIGTYTYKQNG